MAGQDCFLAVQWQVVAHLRDDDVGEQARLHVLFGIGSRGRTALAICESCPWDSRDRQAYTGRYEFADEDGHRLVVEPLVNIWPMQTLAAPQQGRPSRRHAQVDHSSGRQILRLCPATVALRFGGELRLGNRFDHDRGRRIGVQVKAIEERGPVGPLADRPKVIFTKRWMWICWTSICLRRSATTPRNSTITASAWVKLLSQVIRVLGRWHRGLNPAPMSGSAIQAEFLNRCRGLEPSPGRGHRESWPVGSALRSR